VKDALEDRSEIILFDEKTYILKAEYLMAIMLQTGRLSDRERFARFLAEAEYNETLFIEIIKKFNLQKLYNKFKDNENGW